MQSVNALKILCFEKHPFALVQQGNFDLGSDLSSNKKYLPHGTDVAKDIFELPFREVWALGTKHKFLFIMCSVAISAGPQVLSSPLCADSRKAKKMVYPIGPLAFNSVIARPNDDVGKNHWKHLAPRLTRTRSLPTDHHHVGSPPGKSYEDIHRRNLLALGLFLSAAQAAGHADAGQSNSQLADQVRIRVNFRYLFGASLDHRA